MSPLPPDDPLDQTGSWRRRYEDTHPPQHRIEIPFSAIVAITLYLIGNLVTSIWWAATIQSNQQHQQVQITINQQQQQQEMIKLWQKVETHDLQLARMDTMIRQAVREALVDAGYKLPRNNSND
jgi:hypothetical protein